LFSARVFCSAAAFGSERAEVFDYFIDLFVVEAEDFEIGDRKSVV